jgi:tight adherence protein C
MMILLLLTMAQGSGATVRYDDPLNILFLILGAGGGYMLPQFMLSRKAKPGNGHLLSLPHAIDILSISVEAAWGSMLGGLHHAENQGALGQEFAKTLNEIRLASPAWNIEDLGIVPADELKTFVTAVVHASRLGGSITNTLRIQADSIRVRRRQRAQEQAMKAPVKMVFPLVLFIFPALFVVILGPAAMSIYRQLLQ